MPSTPLGNPVRTSGSREPLSDSLVKVYSALSVLAEPNGVIWSADAKAASSLAPVQL
jgi:hypothetical protein